MSSLRVSPDSIVASGARLSGIADEVTTMTGSLSGLTGAADGTPAAEAFEDLLGHWGAVLPHFAQSGASLSAAMGAAGSGYARTDAVAQTAAEVTR